MKLETSNGYPTESALLNENVILKTLQKHDFIQKYVSIFHDYGFVYIVLKKFDFSINNYREHVWKENQIQFFSACIIQSLSYFRQEKLIHRDLHFGNLLFDSDKYINLIDFHITIEYKNKDNPKTYFQ